LLFSAKDLLANAASSTRHDHATLGITNSTGRLDATRCQSRAQGGGVRLESLLARVGLTVDQIDNPEQRITARKQVAFLEAAAEALKDDFLGFSLAEEFNCRDTGLMYYVMASSDTLGDALKRASRYSRIDNEAIVIRYREAPEPTLSLTYSGIPRHIDRQQIEFFIGALVRMTRLLTGRQFLPKRASMVHVRSKGIAKFSRLLGDDIEFGSDSDEIDFPDGSAEWTLVDADQHSNSDLLKFCDESINTRKSNPDTPRQGREYDFYFASPRPRTGGDRYKETWDERANADAKAR
jgi:hypothetical protein